MDQNTTVIAVGVLLIGLYLYACANSDASGNEKTKEGFWYYSPCIYNAQNRMTCSPNFRGYNWMWGLPSRYSPSYDLRGDAWPMPRYGGYFRYPWLA